jgi:outer membrane protein TolC
VTQPNGTLAFQPIFQNNASLSLSVSKPVMVTGGTLFFETNIQRFDDFTSRFKIYNGVPFRFGYRQSLLGFNQFKWAKKVEEKRLSNSKKQLSIEVESILFQAVNQYFDALIAQNNVNIADSNMTANERILLIAQERYNLGKISLDEKIQMESEYKQAVMQLAQSKRWYQQAIILLENFGNTLIYRDKKLEVPKNFNLILPEENFLYQRALANASDLQNAQLQTIMAQQQIAQTKAEMSPAISVFSSLGVARSGDQVGEIYQRPFAEQQIQASITIPIIDWGRKKHAVTSAKERHTLAVIEEEQTTLFLKNVISQRTLELEELQSRLILQEELIQMASERYAIATERYFVGMIPITELFMAQRNKDQMLRDVLISQRDFFLAYYDLRRWTGYDPLTKEEIKY